jgi:phage tail-like protein
MPDRIFEDPFVECFFGVDVSDDDTEVAYFRAVSGGQMSITLIEHNVVYSGGGSSTLFIPGPTSFEPITLYQGVTKDKTLWDWWTQVTQGESVRRNLTITAYGQTITSTELSTLGGLFSTLPDGLNFRVYAQWDLLLAWPLSISGFSFDVDSGKPYIAEITIAAEFIERTA